jgi:hypothetical protein
MVSCTFLTLLICNARDKLRHYTQLICIFDLPSMSFLEKGVTTIWSCYQRKVGHPKRTISSVFYLQENIDKDKTLV